MGDQQYRHRAPTGDGSARPSGGGPSGASTGSPIERRRHYRVQRTVNALFHVGIMTIRGMVLDLSLGGIRMRVSEGAACPIAGCGGFIEIHLASGWHRLRVKVVRSEFDELAVRFSEITPAVEDAIEDEVVASIEASRKPHIVVLDPVPDRRQRICESLRTAGCDPVEAATPLEAIALLERECGGIRGMTISESLTQTRADEVWEYVSQTNPEIHIRLIAEGTRDLSVDDAGAGMDDELAPPPGPPVIVADDEHLLDLALRDFAADAVRTMRPIDHEGHERHEGRDS
jgi:CheY-like chemotaxis protein